MIITLIASLAARNDLVTLLASKSTTLTILSQEAVYIIFEDKLTDMDEIGSVNLYTFSQTPEEILQVLIVQSLEAENKISLSVATRQLILLVCPINGFINSPLETS